MKINCMNIDYGMIVLNATSLATVALSWLSDNLNTAGGFIVMLSVAALNSAKAYKEYKLGKRYEQEIKHEDE